MKKIWKQTLRMEGKEFEWQFLIRNHQHHKDGTTFFKCWEIMARRRTLQTPTWGSSTRPAAFWELTGERGTDVFTILVCRFSHTAPVSSTTLQSHLQLSDSTSSENEPLVFCQGEGGQLSGWLCSGTECLDAFSVLFSGDNLVPLSSGVLQ